MKKTSLKHLFLNALKTLIILFFSTLFALVLQYFGFRVENALIIYVLGILIIIIQTKSFLWGILSSVLYMFLFNFFFTEPKFSLMVNDSSYIVSFIIFLAVAFISSKLTSKLQKQIKISKQNEEMTNRLYKISSGYLNISDIPSIIDYGTKNLEFLINKRCAIYYGEDRLSSGDEAAVWCYKYSSACGRGENNFSELSNKYVPIKIKDKTVGVLRIDCSVSDITKEEMLRVNTMLSLITLAIERELLNLAEEKNRFNIEKEKLKSNLLRSISHDLRTPLTAITGGSGLLIDRLDTLDKETILSLLYDINADSAWLSNMVENLLNMTRIQDGRLLIKQQNEVVDDIVSEAISRVSKRIGKHVIKTDLAKEIFLVPMDGQLIIQVLINLLDNAIKHTKEDSIITIKTEKIGEQMSFSVSDNGGGINADILDKIFDSFVTSTNESTDKHRGTGLGLNICKSIIQAHAGTISAKNNELGGATFTFTLPLKKETFIDG